MSTSTTEHYEELLAAAELSASERYHVLAEERRRIVCNVLAEEEAPISVRRLAADVADRENDQSTTTRSVEISLHHVHLPKLASAGIVDYDADVRRVEAVQATPAERTD